MSDEKVLHLVDSSMLIYGGGYYSSKYIIGEMIRDENDAFTNKRIPSDGISFLFNVIASYGAYDEIVFCFDRNPTYKKYLMPRYKDGRSYNDNIERQKRIAEYILEDCGFNVISVEDYHSNFDDEEEYNGFGFEADDIIFTLAKKYEKEYDRIYIHTNDRDLAISVTDKVQIVPATSTGVHITKSNYDTTVNKKLRLKYNTVSVNKIVDGCSSDNIPRLKPDVLRSAVIQAFSNVSCEEYLGDDEFVLNIFRTAFPAAYRQARVVYPVYLKELYINKEKQPDLFRCQCWGSIVGNTSFTYPAVIPSDLLKKKEDLFEW